jgi:hypothetical protein
MDIRAVMIRYLRELGQPVITDYDFCLALLKAKSRNLQVNKDSLSDDEIMKRSRAEYNTLAGEIDGTLPPFEEVYTAFRNYYESCLEKSNTSE